MEPINYLANVPNPAGAVFEGFAQGQQRQANEQQMAQAAAQEARAAELQPYAVQGAQLGLDQGRQSMQVQADANARANELQPLQVQAQQQQIAAAQREQARAQAFQAEAARLAELGGSMTIADLNRVVTEFPEYGQAVTQSFQAMNEAQQNSVAGVMAQAAFAFKNGNVATANDLIDEYAAAADASGNPQIAATARAIQQTADLDPNAALMSLGLALQSIAPDAAAQIFDAGVEEPASVQALRIRASEAGLQPGTPEYSEFMLSGGGARGTQVVVGPEGGVSIGMGGAPAKEFTEGQSKSVIYATRARGALEELEPIANSLSSRWGAIAERDPTGIAREFQSDEYQTALNAGKEFLAAVLRKDTGAAITEGEMMQYGSIYLPSPSDSPALLQQKAGARSRALAALEAGMGAAEIAAQETALRNSGQTPEPSVQVGTPPQAAAPAVPSYLQQYGGQ